MQKINSYNLGYKYEVNDNDNMDNASNKHNINTHNNNNISNNNTRDRYKSAIICQASIFEFKICNKIHLEIVETLKIYAANIKALSSINLTLTYFINAPSLSQFFSAISTDQCIVEAFPFNLPPLRCNQQINRMHTQTLPSPDNSFNFWYQPKEQRN